MVANCSNSLDTDVLRCILSIYIKVTCTLKASHSVTSICVTMSLPVCIVDVRSVKSLSSGRFLVHRFISGGTPLAPHRPAPPCSCFPVCTAQRRRHARTQAATETGVFLSMTGSTWKYGAAGVSGSLRRVRDELLLLSPGFPPRHVLTDSL